MSTIIPIDKTKKTKMILMAGAMIIIVTVLIFAGLYLFRKNAAASIIRDELKKAALVMEFEKNKIGGYPATIDGLLSVSNKVSLAGGGSFDGMSFCIAGTSTSDKSVVFHVDSAKSKTDVLGGSCESSSGGLAPLIPSGLTIAFASTDSIKVTWNKATYAMAYTLQCSIDMEFDDSVTVEATNPEGVCTNLKPDTAYYYRVKATNSVGASAWSAESQFKTSKN